MVVGVTVVAVGRASTTLCILGLMCLVPMLGWALESALVDVDIPVMAAVTRVHPRPPSGRCLARREGPLFTAAYVVYLYIVTTRT